MKYKNDLEKRVFEIAQAVFGPSVSVEHNKVVEIQDTSHHETASFAGPPKKEVDVISALIIPSLTLLVSCKLYASKADPIVIQEWAAVVNVMNRYSGGTRFVGLVICPSGFSAGCEAWATSNNIGIIPPIKGTRVSYETQTTKQMTRRALLALKRRMVFPFEDLLRSPHFYDFCHDLTADFEGRDVQIQKNGSHYSLLPSDWLSSFGELISTLLGRTIIDVVSTSECVGLILSGGYLFLKSDNGIKFGVADPQHVPGHPKEPECRKNLGNEACTFDFIKALVVGKELCTAGDMGAHFEFGVEENLNLSFSIGGLHVVRTLNPAELNRL